MAALDRFSVSHLGVSSSASTGLFRKAAAEAIWQWFDEHKDETIWEKGIGPFKIRLRIRDLAFLIERIAGPKPFPR